MPKSFTIETAILCDDIRHEINNKAILIGVYTGDLVVPIFPAALRLCLFLIIRDVPLGEHEFEVTFESPDGSAGVGGTLVVHDEKPLVIATPQMPAHFSEPAEIKVKFRVGDGRPKPVVIKKVEAAESLPMADTEQH